MHEFDFSVPRLSVVPLFGNHFFHGHTWSRAHVTNKTDTDCMERDCRLLFRHNVAGRAEMWYNHQSREVRQDWEKLKANCLERYKLPDEDPVATITRMEASYNSMKQGREESITEFLERTDDFQGQVWQLRFIPNERVLNSGRTYSPSGSSDGGEK
ncbi:hypothetical protein N7517_008452 [Penicillium concentricum]|uniref:Retrotransposon gag domain-containing protein n=1 Tax=Penicillium concentricum TaxID=293559 RepID=A0A9W9RSK1_9EURO|nr:uncharacterized protein N7517_008452 [Penicillium concentricum]KAJ5365566.1 hypothetical protein N7517_008452 [Penicillium concentricum]